MNSFIDVLPRILPFVPLFFVLSTGLSLLAAYPRAKVKTSKNHRDYVPPEKRVFGPFTLGDIVFAAFFNIWIYVTIAIVAYLTKNHWMGNPDMTKEKMTQISVAIFMVGPILGGIISHFVEKNRK